MGFAGKGSRRRSQKLKALQHKNLLRGLSKPKTKCVENLQTNAMESPVVATAPESHLPRWYRIPQEIQDRAGTSCCLSPLKQKK